MKGAPKPTRRRTRRRILTAVIAGTLAIPLGYWAYVGWYRTNFHTVVPGRVYRSAQPSPDELKQWTRRYGLKTVINLRGVSLLPFHEAEKAAAAEAGLEHIDIRLSAKRLPSAVWLRKLIRALDTAQRPLLIHCRAGADRTGVASVLAAMLDGKQDYQTAKKQLSVWYFHLDPDPDHIAGLLLRYEESGRGKGLGRGGWDEFRQWAMREYHTHYYSVKITGPSRIVARPGERVRVRLRILNDSGETIPAGDAGKIFTLAAFTGSSEADAPDREFGRTRLPSKDIAHGEEITVEHVFMAPRGPTTEVVHFDLIEEGRTFFARQGSKVWTAELRVTAPN